LTRQETPPMTRPKNQEAIEKEARLQEAMAAVLAKKHNASSNAHAFNIPNQILYDRLDGKSPRNKAHETEQLLSHVEEKELIRWITRLEITGYPPRYDTLRKMVEEIGKRRVKNINENGLELVRYDDIGKQWIARFLYCPPELSGVRPRSVDAVRVKDISPERLQR
jgi:hypothetical protein